MENNFLADVQLEGRDTFENTVEKDTPSESLTEKEPKESEVKEEPKEGDSTPEKDIPFHQHPRWIERENELKELRQRDEERSREMAELKSFKEELYKSNDSIEVPEWFGGGVNTPENKIAWQKYLAHEEQKAIEIEQRLIEKQEQQKIQQETETKYWSKWVDEGIDKLIKEDNFNPSERNELIKTMLKYRPTDEEGNFDFKAGLEIYRTMNKENPAHSNARKQLADETTKSSRGDKKEKDYKTSNDLRGKSWSNIV